MYKDRNQREFARGLRNNLTDAERRLWSKLRCEQLREYKFRRQAAIGTYIVDFVCFDRKLVVELDGGQHNDAARKNYDTLRSEWLISQGFRVLRFWNHQVLEDSDGVIEVIWQSLSEVDPNTPPSPALPTRGREPE